MTTLCNCPFCDSPKLDYGDDESGKFAFVFCRECNAQGPYVRNQTKGSGTQSDWNLKAKSEAAHRWNQRANLKGKP